MFTTSTPVYLCYLPCKIIGLCTWCWSLQILYYHLVNNLDEDTSVCHICSEGVGGAAGLTAAPCQQRQPAHQRQCARAVAVPEAPALTFWGRKECGCCFTSASYILCIISCGPSYIHSSHLAKLTQCGSTPTHPCQLAICIYSYIYIYIYLYIDLHIVYRYISIFIYLYL